MRHSEEQLVGVKVQYEVQTEHEEDRWTTAHEKVGVFDTRAARFTELEEAIKGYKRLTRDYPDQNFRLVMQTDTTLREEVQLRL